MHALLKKDAVFNWSSECEDAFGRLKEALVNAPVLAYPQFEDQHPFILHTSYGCQYPRPQSRVGSTAS